MKLALGVLIFNPFDDENHLERIKNCLTSLCSSAKYCSEQDVELLFLLNMSEPLVKKVSGVGDKTINLVNSVVKENGNLNIKLLEYSYKDSMNVKGYNYILKYLYNNSKAEAISVFADDYIVPNNWFNFIEREFKRKKKADFIMPATTFVAQTNLLIPFEFPAHWKMNNISNRLKSTGVLRGVTQEDVNFISKESQKYPTINYFPPNSFETTFFSRKCLDKYGFLCDAYYSLFYNNEYFARIVKKGARGYISRKAMVFHYGKGGTAAVYKKTRDEKYKGSPAEKYLKKDVDLYNKRNNQNIEYFWMQSKNREPSRVERLSVSEIESLIKHNNIKSYFVQSDWFFRIIQRVYQIFKRVSRK